MKKQALMLFLLLISLSACQNNKEEKMNRELRQDNCLALTNIIQQNLANNASASQTLDEVFYSPKLDSCVFGYQVKESFYLNSYPDQKTLGSFNDKNALKEFTKAKKDLKK